MNLRETVINSAIIEYAKHETRLRAALRRVAVDNTLAGDGMQTLTADECQEVDAAARREELPYSECDGQTCGRCG